MSILKTNSLTKCYNNEPVVDSLNMTIDKGDIYGFLGQNGAGKTTTLSMIMGLIKPDNGYIELFDKDINNTREVYGKIGSIIEFSGFYKNLTAFENLKIHQNMMCIYDYESIEKTLELVGLSDSIDKKVNDFSLGMKQRLGIGRAILHKPELLVLDEPINGLDPVGIKDVRDIIIKLNKEENITFLISSHILSEIQNIATKIGIIKNGILIEEMSYKDIYDSSKVYIEIKVDNDRKAAMVIDQVLKIEDFSIWEKNVIRIYNNNDLSAKINRTLVTNNIEVSEIKINTITLEDYFIKLTGKN